MDWAFSFSNPFGKGFFYTRAGVGKPWNLVVNFHLDKLRRVNKMESWFPFRSGDTWKKSFRPNFRSSLKAKAPTFSSEEGRAWPT
jgi:hypothetical protein